MPNDLVQFDYIESGPSSDGSKFILMVCDGKYDSNWFFPFHTGTATGNASTAMIDLCELFGIINGPMYYGTIHFKNDSFRALKKALKIPHHLTRPYTPWRKFSVERLEKEISRTFLSIISELRIGFDECPEMIAIIHSVLVTVPLPKRGNLSPITDFTRLNPTPPISTLIEPSMVLQLILKMLKLVVL